MEQSKIIDTLETYHQVTSRFIESTIATRLQSMIEHDGLGITYFSVDISKDMAAC